MNDLQDRLLGRMLDRKFCLDAVHDHLRRGSGMRNLLKNFLLLAFMSLLSCRLYFGQAISGDDGRSEGCVERPSLPPSRVTNLATGFKHTKTNSQGEYRFVNLPAGHYSVRCHRRPEGRLSRRRSDAEQGGDSKHHRRRCRRWHNRRSKRTGGGHRYHYADYFNDLRCQAGSSRPGDRPRPAAAC